jgi:hypothetical protein
MTVYRRRDAFLVAEATHVLCDHGYLRKGWCHECGAMSSGSDVLDRSVMPVADLAVAMTPGARRVTVASSLLDAVRRARWLV